MWRLWLLISVIGVAACTEEKAVPAEKRDPVAANDIVEVNAADVHAEDRPETYKKLSWDLLSKAQFKPAAASGDNAGLVLLEAHEAIDKLHHKWVEMQGFLIPLEPEIGIYALSANPNATCFFCGAAGPESVVQLEVAEPTAAMTLDAYLTFRGKFKVNHTDPYSLAFKMEKAACLD